MTEIMIETAEQDFLKNNFASAFKWASLAMLLDPFYGSVDIYAEAYRIHFSSLKKTSTGEMDLYGVLGFKEPFSSVSCETITHEFVRLANMIKPEKHNSAAAPGALKLITNAWEILGEPDTRRSYDIRAGLLAPSQPLKKRGSVVSLAQSQPVTKNTGSGGLLVSPQLMKRRDNAGFLAPSCPVMKKRGTAISLAPSQPVTKKTGSGGLPASPQLMKRRDNAGFLTPSCPVMKKRGRAVGERVSQGVETSKYSLTSYV